MRHLLHEIVAARKLCDLQDFFVAGTALADADVVLDARVEQHHVLEDDGEIHKERFRINLADVLPAERYLAALNIPEACREFCCSRLSATARAHKCCDFALLCRERNLFQDLLVLVVIEIDVLEFDIVILGSEFRYAFLRFHLVHFAKPAQAHIHKEQFGEVVEYQVNRIVDSRRAHDEHQVSKHVDFALGPEASARNQHRGKAHLENALCRIQERTHLHVGIHLRFFVVDAVFVKMVEIGGFARVGTDFLHVFETLLDIFHNRAAGVI